MFISSGFSFTPNHLAYPTVVKNERKICIFQPHLPYNQVFFSVFSDDHCVSVSSVYREREIERDGKKARKPERDKYFIESDWCSWRKLVKIEWKNRSGKNRKQIVECCVDV